jgi:hypothetical protein
MFFSTGYRVQDFCLTIFLLSQLNMGRMIWFKNLSNFVSVTNLAMLLSSAMMIWSATQHADPANKGVFSPAPWWLGGNILSATLSYPAMWTFTYGSIASMITHIPIFSMCSKEDDLHYWPLALVFFSLITFLISPQTGFLLALAAHAAQVIYNVGVIKKLKGLRRAYEERKAGGKGSVTPRN